MLWTAASPNPRSIAANSERHHGSTAHSREPEASDAAVMGGVGNGSSQKNIPPIIPKAAAIQPIKQEEPSSPGKSTQVAIKSIDGIIKCRNMSR